MIELSTRDLDVPGSSQGDANFSSRNFLGGKEFTRIAQVNLAFYLNWMENEYQLRLG